jgi:hypothetical protein
MKRDSDSDPERISEVKKDFISKEEKCLQKS